MRSSTSKNIVDLRRGAKRRYSPEELDYIRNYAHMYSDKKIADHLKRSPHGIKKQRIRLRLLRPNEPGLTTRQVADLLMITTREVSNKIAAGQLKPCGRATHGKTGHLVFSNDDLRAFVLQHRPRKKILCVDCKEITIGDIYCDRCRPHWLTKPKNFTSRLDTSNYRQFCKSLGRSIKERRELMGMQQEELADKSGFSIYHIRNVENAKYKNISLDTVIPIFKALHMHMRLTMEAF